MCDAYTIFQCLYFIFSTFFFFFFFPLNFSLLLIDMRVIIFIINFDEINLNCVSYRRIIYRILTFENITFRYNNDYPTAQFLFAGINFRCRDFQSTYAHTHITLLGKTVVERFKFFFRSLKRISVHARVITMDAIPRKSGISKCDQTRSERTPGNRKARND